MFKRFVLLFAAVLGADLLWLSTWIWTEQPSNDMGILGVVIPPVLLGANLGLGLLCWLLRQPQWRNAFLVNAVLAPVLYSLLLLGWFRYSLARQFAQFTFTQGPKHYSLTLSKLGTQFDILEQLTPGSSLGVLMGNYQHRHDTTYLRDPYRHKQCFLYHDYLYHFEGNSPPILVRPAE